MTCHPLLWAFNKLQAPLGKMLAHVQCSVERPALAYLRDHTILGRALLPTSALLEAAGAAAMLLSNLSESTVEGHCPQSLGVGEVVLSGPAMLPAPGDGSSALGASSIRGQQHLQRAVLDCTVDCMTGNAEVGTGTSLRPEAPGALSSQPNFTPVMHGYLHSLHRPVNPTPSPAAGPATGLPGRQKAQPKSDTKPGSRASEAWVRHCDIINIEVLTTFPDVSGLELSGYHVHPATTDAAIHAAAALHASPSATATSRASPLRLPAAAGLYAVNPSTCAPAHSAIAVLAPSQQRSATAGSTSLHELIDDSQAAACPVMSLQGLLTRPPTQRTHLPQAPHFSSQPQAEAKPAAAAAASLSPMGLVSCPSADAVREIVERVIGNSIDEDQPLLEAGLDSIGAVELRNAIASAFGVELPATVTFDYPTVQALTGFLVSLPQLQLVQGEAPDSTLASNADIMQACL